MSEEKITRGEPHMDSDGGYCGRWWSFESGHEKESLYVSTVCVCTGCGFTSSELKSNDPKELGKNLGFGVSKKYQTRAIELERYIDNVPPLPKNRQPLGFRVALKRFLFGR